MANTIEYLSIPSIPTKAPLGVFLSENKNIPGPHNGLNPKVANQNSPPDHPGCAVVSFIVMWRCKVARLAQRHHNTIGDTILGMESFQDLANRGYQVILDVPHRKEVNIYIMIYNVYLLINKYYIYNIHIYMYMHINLNRYIWQPGDVARLARLITMYYISGKSLLRSVELKSW